jgi:hypothetical protein
MMRFGERQVRVMTRILGNPLLYLAATLLALSQPAWGQSVPAPSPLEQSMQAVPGPALGQKYDGVAPGAASKNPLPSAPAGPHLVWTGFQMTSSGSRVFLQTTAPVEFDVKQGSAPKPGKSVLSVVLRGCRIHMANNRREIDTRFFATPVAGVSARHKGRDVEVQIALREAASTTPHSETGPDGTQFLVMDFPPGKAAPAPTALEEMAGGARSETSQADLDQRPGPSRSSAKKPLKLGQ